MISGQRWDLKIQTDAHTSPEEAHTEISLLTKMKNRNLRLSFLSCKTPSICFAPQTTERVQEEGATPQLIDSVSVAHYFPI